MKRYRIHFLTLTAFVVLAVLGWLVIPAPFAHGVIVGFLASLVALLASILILGLILRRKMAKRGESGLKPPDLPTGTWDYVMDLTDLDGAPVPPLQWAGKVVVLNFWATWCGPCLRELPSLQRLMELTRDLDVRFGFITQESAEDARRFVEKRSIQLPIYVLGGPPPEYFKTRGIPATFVIERGGGIVLRHTGAAAWDGENIVAFVRGLAAKP
jgi:thiol-disulfide isomerase/thioredoxin